MDDRFKLTRLVRTTSSEVYLIWEGERRIGQVDLHYARDTIHATLVFEVDVSVSTEEELHNLIDEDIVSSYLPRFEREDFVVHVFRGQEISRYTDCSGAMDEIDEMEEEGRRRIDFGDLGGIEDDDDH